MGARVAQPCGLVAGRRGRVAIGRRLSPEIGRPRATQVRRKPMDLGRLTLVARDLIGVQRRFPWMRGQLLVGARLVLCRRFLVAQRVRVVSLGGRLVGI